MTDIVFHHISHEERCEKYSYHGIYEIEPVGPHFIERTGENDSYLGNEVM